ncbi:TlpA family protein disulfide reductase [Bacillus kwashiorkori]|uniref:TlpA family protein disulfide reductase n=1 Tax=Bacillus kwashiorkori TaxID=1522318 RepID=UPI0007860F3D|nr:TlpA family protein disulfide reductase [Bacillus kwashiorkori]
MKKIFIGFASVIVALFIVDQAVLQEKAVLPLFTKAENNENNGEERTTQNNDINTDNQNNQLEEPSYGLQVGNLAPDFSLTTLDGKNISLKDLRGKKVLLNFWASWCPPCRAEMPHMQKVYEEHAGESFEIVAVNLTFGKETAEKAQQFVTDFGLTFPIPLDTTAEVSENYQIVPIPTSYFIDSNGIIQSKYLGPMDEKYILKQINAIK